MINNILYKTIITFILCSSVVIAGGKIYDFRECKNYDSATSCSKCKIEGKMTFKLDNESKSIIVNFIIDSDKTSHNIVFSNCKIFDNDTLECYRDGPHDKFTLNNGVFISSHEYPEFKTYDCGKEIKGFSSWFN